MRAPYRSQALLSSPRLIKQVMRTQPCSERSCCTGGGSPEWGGLEGAGQCDGQAPAFREGTPSWRKAPEGAQAPAPRDSVMHTTQPLSHCPHLKPAKQAENENCQQHHLGAWSIQRGSCRMLPTDDHVLGDLTEQSEAHAFSRPKSPPSFNK